MLLKYNRIIFLFFETKKVSVWRRFEKILFHKNPVSWIEGSVQKASFWPDSYFSCSKKNQSNFNAISENRNRREQGWFQTTLTPRSTIYHGGVTGWVPGCFIRCHIVEIGSHSRLTLHFENSNKLLSKNNQNCVNYTFNGTLGNLW